MDTNNNHLTGKVEVCGHRVLLKASFDSNEIQSGALKGFKMETDEMHDRSKAATITGVVAAVGPMAWKAFDYERPGWKQWAEVGDTVIFAKYAGKYITVKDETYIIINDEDIQAVLMEDNSE